MGFISALFAVVGFISGLISIYEFITARPGTNMRRNSILVGLVAVGILLFSLTVANLPTALGSSGINPITTPSSSPSATDIPLGQTTAAPTPSPTIGSTPTPSPTLGPTPTPTPSPITETTETWKGRFDQEGGSLWGVQLVVTQAGSNLQGMWSYGNYNSGQYTNGSVQVEGAIVIYGNLTQKVQNDLTSYFGVTFQSGQHIVSWQGTGVATGNIWTNGQYYAIRFGNELRGIAYQDSQSGTFSNFSLSPVSGSGQLGN